MSLPPLPLLLLLLLTSEPAGAMLIRYWGPLPPQNLGGMLSLAIQVWGFPVR